eukprot:2403545-Prymnesium_polylepis.1
MEERISEIAEERLAELNNKRKSMADTSTTAAAPSAIAPSPADAPTDAKEDDNSDEPDDKADDKSGDKADDKEEAPPTDETASFPVGKRPRAGRRQSLNFLEAAGQRLSGGNKGSFYAASPQKARRNSVGDEKESRKSFYSPIKSRRGSVQTGDKESGNSPVEIKSAFAACAMEAVKSRRNSCMDMAMKTRRPSFTLASRRASFSS